MEKYSFLVYLLVINCIQAVCFAKTSADDTRSDDQFLSKDGAQSDPLSSGNGFDKKSFGKSPFNAGNFQTWREWMEKRGLGQQSMNGAKFGGSYSSVPGLQQWQNAITKRGFSSSSNENSFKMGAPISGQQFQMWTDWMKKRSLGGLPGSSATFGHPVEANNMQGWVDFSKKANFGADSPDFFGVPGVQTWHASKRGLGSQSLEPFSIPFGQNPLLSRWGGMSKRGLGSQSFEPFSVPFGQNPLLSRWDGMSKRGLGSQSLEPFSTPFGHNTPLSRWNEMNKRFGGRVHSSNFGKAGQYFTNGLQDWRNVFKNAKREQEKKKSSKQKS